MTQLQGELAMLHGYMAARVHVLPLSRIPHQGPIIPPYKPGYMPAPPGPSGGWGSFAQTQGPSQDPRYTPGALGGADPSTNLFIGDDDDDDNDDADQFFRDDDSQQGQLLLQHDVAPTWACMYFSCILQTLLHGGPIMYVYYALLFDRPGHVCIILPNSGP